MRELITGDKVMWDNNPKDWGVVTETTNDKFTVRWSTYYDNTYTYDWGSSDRITRCTNELNQSCQEHQALALLLSRDELFTALQELYCQAMQAKEGFGIYNGSESMASAINAAKTAIEKGQSK